MIVYKKFTIESARSLPNLPDNHPCNRVHGHSFKIIISLEGSINKKTGFVIDLADRGINKLSKLNSTIFNSNTINRISLISKIFLFVLFGYFLWRLSKKDNDFVLKNFFKKK